MTLVFRHDNGWLEVETKDGRRGYVAPAWVEEVAEEERAPQAAIPPPPESPLPPPPSPAQPQQLQKQASQDSQDDQQQQRQQQQQQPAKPSRLSGSVSSPPSSPKHDTKSLGKAARPSTSEEPGEKPVPPRRSQPKLLFTELVQETTVDSSEEEPKAGAGGDEERDLAKHDSEDEDGKHSLTLQHAAASGPSSSSTSPNLSARPGPPKTAEKPRKPAPVVRARPASFHSPALERSEKVEAVKNALNTSAATPNTAASHAGAEAVGRIGGIGDFQAQLAARLGAPPAPGKKAPPQIPQRSESTKVSEEG
jgi:hypothetical protein